MLVFKKVYALSERFIFSCWCVNGDFERKWKNLCQWQITGKGHNAFPSVRDQQRDYTPSQPLTWSFPAAGFSLCTCWNWKPILVRLSLEVLNMMRYKNFQLKSIIMVSLTLNICSKAINSLHTPDERHISEIYFRILKQTFNTCSYCPLHSPNDTYTLLMPPYDILWTAKSDFHFQ